MPEPMSIAAVIVAIVSALGGIGTCAHFKLKSNCFSCCNSECWDNETKRVPSTSKIIETPPKNSEV